ncbi:hypothetical protein MTP99_016628 [Tenebrio molitor]|nr:hypothetical protein MTP99_016628 [Tenebrio molitor]
MRSAVILVALVASTTAAPQVSKLRFRNLYKHPLREPRNVLPRIIGGQEAAPHSIPSQAFLEMYTENEGWYCGGSLISENYVLTAGHCGEDVVKAMVSLGAHALSESVEGEITVDSQDVTVHADYDGNVIINDIAVIKLPEPVTLSDTIQPVALPTTADVDNTFTGEEARVSGWGLTDGFDEILSDVLNYVDVKVISNEECLRDYDNVIDSILCTSGDARTGSCEGDSGGPLILNGTQIGIVSYGITYCLPGYPSGFTRVTSFLEWIGENTDVQIE